MLLSSNRIFGRAGLFVSVGVAASLAATLPAAAECTRLGFSVNDYGKEGPTNDAKALLDKHIATKMAERGVKTYRTGKKDVTCELFLNFIIFDEHTCTAEATVCWDGTPLPKGEQVAAPAGDAAAAKQTTGSIEKPAATKPAEKKTAAKKLDDTAAKPAVTEKPATTAAAPAAAPAATSEAKASAKPEEHYEAVKSDAPTAMPGAPADLGKNSSQPADVAPVAPTSPSP